MMKDGVEHRKSAIQGWAPIEEALLSGIWTMSGEYSGEVWVKPKRILGMCRDGRSVHAYYRADGDYVDRWTDRSGRVVYDLTHYRLPGKGVRP